MNRIMVKRLAVAFAVGAVALPAAAAIADELDGLDVTMVVLDSEQAVDSTIADLRGPKDKVDRAAAYELESQATSGQSAADIEKRDRFGNGKVTGFLHLDNGIAVGNEEDRLEHESDFTEREEIDLDLYEMPDPMDDPMDDPVDP